MPKKIVTPEFDSIDPRNCLNGKLRKLHRLINSAYMIKLKPFGLRGSMLSILFIIGKRENINQKSLAELLILDASTMSRDLKKMIDKGWVQKKKGEDSRNSELTLTKAGFKHLEQVVPIWKKLHHKVENIISSYQIDQIDQLIVALQENQIELKA